MYLSSPLLGFLIRMHLINLLDVLQLFILLLLHVDHLLILLLFGVGPLFLLLATCVWILLLFMVLLKKLLFKLLILLLNLFLHQLILVNLVLVLTGARHLNSLHDTCRGATCYSSNGWPILYLHGRPIRTDLVTSSQRSLIKRWNLGRYCLAHLVRIHCVSIVVTLTIVYIVIVRHRRSSLCCILRLHLELRVIAALLYCASYQNIHFDYLN